MSPEAFQEFSAQQLIVNGELGALRILGGKRGAGRKPEIEVRNPHTGDRLGAVPCAGEDEVRAAVDWAMAYRPKLSRHDRAQILERCAAMIRERREAIAQLITAESGLSIHDARYEVSRVLEVLASGAREVLRDDGQIFSCDLSAQGKARKVFTQRFPLLGVIAAITPFNHPMNQVAHKVVPSIATNNRMVLKPSEKVPFSAMLLADLLYEAGLPAPMLQILSGEPGGIVDALLAHPDVEMLSFTGGVAIGQAIARKAGYRRLVLELGGNDPLIVMDDADLEEASTLAVLGSYRNSGQRCTAIKRMLVHQAVAEEFTARLLEKTRHFGHGDPLEEANEMGTVIDANAALRIARSVDEAIAQGARLLHGHQREGALYAPTVLDRVRPEMRLVREETFGPVSPVIRFQSVDEAIAIANSTAYGLSSAVCTKRLDDIDRFVHELHVGTVNIREVPGYRLEITPFGGIKSSGLGYKEGVQEAIRSFTHLKTYSLPWGVP